MGRSPHRIEGVFKPGDQRSVVLLRPPKVARPGPLNRFELEQPGAERELRVQTQLADLLVVGPQYRRAGRVQFRLEKGFSAGAVKDAGADVQGAETVAVTGCDVEVPLLGAALVEGVVVVEGQRVAQAAPGPRKGAGTVVGQAENLDHSPIRGPGEMGHGLAQLFLFVGVFDQIGLVDDIDQVARFRHSPEHPVDPEAQLPFTAVALAEPQQIGLAQVEMGSVRVGAVVAEKGGQRKAAAAGVFKMEFRFRHHAAGVPALLRIGSGLGMPATLQAQATGKLVVNGRSRRPWGHPEQGHPNRNENDVDRDRAPPHQRIRLSPVRVKSFSFRLFWN